MVSLDNFILFDTPYSSCDNSDYIGSPRVRSFTSRILLGDNKLYERYNGLWVLKSVLVDNTLITDYSFEAVDILEEQILILSAFDKVVTIQFETLWEYFKLPSVAELNKISKQLTDRKIEGYHNPLKATYYTLLDDGKTVLSFEDWEVEMNTLHTKWLFCERSRLTDSGYDKDTIEDYLSNRTFKEFLKKFYDDGIQFYSKEVEEVDVTTPEYTEALNFLRLSTGLGEVELCRNMRSGFNNYIDYIINFIHTLSREEVVQYATLMYEYHMGKLEEALVTATVQSDSEYTEARDLLLANSVITSSDLNPSPTETLTDYLQSLVGEIEMPYNDILHYGTIVYNYNRGTVVEVIDHPF